MDSVQHEQHQRVNEQQDRLDMMDLHPDQSIGLDPAHAQEMTALYIDQVDELQARLIQLNESVGGEGEELGVDILSMVADYLESTDHRNYIQAAEAFSALLNEQLERVEDLEWQKAVPDEFKNLAGVLFYNPDEMGDYYNVYMRNPESVRIPICDINGCLRDTCSLLDHLEDVSDIRPNTHREQLMAEAFCFLVQGNQEAFEDHMDRLDLSAQYHEAQAAAEENGGLSEDIEKLQSQTGKLQVELANLWEKYNALQVENPGWASNAVDYVTGLAHDQWYQGTNEYEMDQTMRTIEDMEFRLFAANSELQPKQRRLKENEAIILEFQFSAASADPETPQDELDRMVLEMSIQLGDYMPGHLRDMTSEAYQRLTESGDVSAFDLAYYAGEGAVSIAVDEYNVSLEAGEDVEDKEKQLLKAVEGDKSLTALQDYSSKVFEVFQPMQNLIMSAYGEDSGAATIETALKLKSMAEDLGDVYDAATMRSLLGNAKSSLDAFDNLNLGGDLNEFGEMVKNMQASLNGVENIVENDQITQICDMARSAHAEDFARWLTTDGLVLITAIGAGLLIVTGVGAVAGAAILTAGVKGLVISSALMATGSLIGAEIGKELSDKLFDTGLQSEFMMAWEGKMDWDDLALSYAKQWGMNFAMSIALLGAGKAFCAAGNANVAGLSRFSRFTQEAYPS